MLNSRDINQLRPDIAVNCRKLIELAAEKGWKVLVTGTVRDDEYQMKCYNEGHSKAKTPTFHSVKAGLAFDICQNIKGHEYDNLDFWACVSEIGKHMGFTWGGDWTTIVDKPHFQWDDHGRYTGSMVRTKQYPPIMHTFEQEGDDMSIDELKKDLISVKDTGDKHSDWAADAVEMFKGAGVFNGDGMGNYGWGQLMTREAAAKILYNLLDKLDLLDKLK